MSFETRRVAAELSAIAKTLVAEQIPDELLKKFNADGLEKEITKRLGVKPAGLKVELTGSLEVGTSNLVGQAGIFAGVMDDVRVRVFGTARPTKDSRNGKWFVGGEIDVSWEGKRGGTNGLKLCRAFFVFDDAEWVFYE